MSEWKNSKEMDDKELENVSGGSGEKQSKIYRCSTCGETRAMYYDDPLMLPNSLFCTKCQLEGRGLSRMFPA